MATFKKVIDPVSDKIINTLSFMGKEYSETWVQNNTHCDCGLEALVMHDYPNMPGEDAEIIQNITSMDEDELLEALFELTDYERCE